MEIEKKVGDKTYTFKKLKVKQAIAFNARILKIVGPGLKSGMPDDLKDWRDQDLASIAGGIMSGLNPEEVADFIESTIREMVLTPAAIGQNGSQETFERYFAEFEDELYEAFYACIEIQSSSIINFLKKKLMGSEKPITDSTPQTQS